MLPVSRLVQPFGSPGPTGTSKRKLRDQKDSARQIARPGHAASPGGLCRLADE